MLAVAVALSVMAPRLEASAETAADAIGAFGLVGKWSSDCTPESPEGDHHFSWDFRIAEGGKATLRQITFYPHGFFAIFEKSDVQRRIYDISIAERSGAATLDLTRKLASLDFFDSISFKGLSTTWFAFWWPLNIAVNLDMFSVPIKESLTRDGKRIRTIYLQHGACYGSTGCLPEVENGMHVRRPEPGGSAAALPLTLGEQMPWLGRCG